MVRRVCLCEKEHAVSILHKLNQMQHDEDFCDFTIQVKKNLFRVHKCVIASGSPYFKAMLKHDTKESREGKVEMMDVDLECVKNCIEFLYSGNFDIPDGKTRQLLHIAIMMQLDKMKDAICKILDEELNPEKFYETRTIATMYNLHQLSKTCKNFYEKNFIAISAQPGFENETNSHIIDILKSESYDLTNKEKLAACLSWIGENVDRKGSLVEMIKLIDVRKVDAKYLRDLLEHHPLICSDLQLYKLINAPLVEIATTSRIGDDEERRIVLFDFTNDYLRMYDPNANAGTVNKFHGEKFNHLGCLTAVSIYNYIYILCMGRSVHRLNFKDENSKWERMQDMIADHGQFPPVVSLSGSIFVIGSCNEATKDVSKFEPSENGWLKLQDKQNAISDPILVSLNDSIYCFGRRNEDGIWLASFCRFTPSTSEWADLEPPHNETSFRIASAVAVNTKIYVFGGLESPTDYYDVDLSQWTSLSAKNVSSYDNWGDTHYIKGWIYFVSGIGSPTRIRKYDPSRHRWSEEEESVNFGPCYSITVHL